MVRFDDIHPNSKHIWYMQTAALHGRTKPLSKYCYISLKSCFRVWCLGEGASAPGLKCIINGARGDCRSTRYIRDVDPCSEVFLCWFEENVEIDIDSPS